MLYTIMMVGFGASLLYLFLIRLFGIVKPDRSRKCNVQDVDSVSASMLLAEVDPSNWLQNCIVLFIVLEEKVRFQDFCDRFISEVITSDKDSRFLHRLPTRAEKNNKRWIKMESTWTPRSNCISHEGLYNPCSVQELISSRLTNPLDVTKPLWELGFIECFTETEEHATDTHRSLDSRMTSAIILTMHHTMGDGFTLCRQFMQNAAPADPRFSMHECYPFQGLKARKNSDARSHLGRYLKYCKSLAKLALMPPDKPSYLRRSKPRKITDRIACDFLMLPMGVSELKQISKDATKLYHKRGCLPAQSRISINDLAVAAVTIAFNRFNEGQLRREKAEPTSVIWVDLNRDSVLSPGPKSWGNSNLGFCYMSLATSLDNDLDILLESHNRLHALKDSPEPVVANHLLRLLGLLPQYIAWPLRHKVMDKISTSVSNFPGPVHKLKFPVKRDENDRTNHLPGVATVKDVFYWVAPSLSFGPHVSIISYAGKMYVSLAVTESLMRQPVASDLVKTLIPSAFQLISQDIVNCLNVE